MLLPVCYMEMDGRMTDLSHLCGSDGTDADIFTVTIPSSPSISMPPSVWTRNIHFDNERWSSFLGAFTPTSAITGNVHNSGNSMVENVVVEATGYAEGRTPQTRQATIQSISADDAVPVTIDFGFSVPVTSWDVRILDWE